MKAFVLYIAAVSLYLTTIFGAMYDQTTKISNQMKNSSLNHPIQDIRKQAGLKIVNVFKCQISTLQDIGVKRLVTNFHNGKPIPTKELKDCHSAKVIRDVQQ